MALETDPTFTFLFDLEEKLTKELNTILDQEEAFWHIRSRNWLMDGDRNTHFFHLSTIFRRKNNKILMIKDETGNSITNPNDINNAIMEHYQNLFLSEHLPPPPDIISNESLNCCQIPAMMEVKEAIFSIGRSKALGDDGYYAHFYHHFWEAIRMDCFNCVKDIFTSLDMPKSMHSTLISLIPKIDNPLRLNNFRPISLVNTSYKIITKILVQRIRPYLKDIISPNHNSFIPGRGSEENFIIASEILHTMNKKKGKKGLFALKLDLEKAYDRLEWPFIEHCLKRLNFTYDSIKLIMSCVNAGQSCFQVNGNRTNDFTPSRGIRQGDPLSPHLFIICLEYLSRTIHEACASKVWTPFRVRGVVRRFHIFSLLTISYSLEKLTTQL